MMRDILRKWAGVKQFSTCRYENFEVGNPGFPVSCILTSCMLKWWHGRKHGCRVVVGSWVALGWRRGFWESITQDTNRCIQNPELGLGNDTAKIILNTKGTMDDVTTEWKRMLDDVIHNKEKTRSRRFREIIGLE
ncbi:MAG: hypothetical protein HFI74_07120 [Lachnospiraceae bacterium]|jgi:hypothetical protein|nr:hypothetical protein [Lachnospiraceae bacterium]